ncbi:hypothetical protein AB4Z38_03150 [Arthrobacter sp. 2RAF6]|uniref:hypothetical protein n=1 Tax=Arthrobacter sp. 2RAF6 TaxID=3233002 RepID=UPI003F909012
MSSQLRRRPLEIPRLQHHSNEAISDPRSGSNAPSLVLEKGFRNTLPNARQGTV